MQAPLTFDQVNDAVNATFFNGQFDSVPVYLDADGGVLDELAGRLGLAPENTIPAIGNVVSQTLRWAKPTHLYDSHKTRLDDWAGANTPPPPPFSALLLVLAAAAGKMREDEQYLSTNYYQRLREILGDPAKAEVLRAAGHQTEDFWQALNGWLISTDHRYGQPTAMPQTERSYRYVNYAVSQSLVREVDRVQLRDMLLTYGFSKGDRVPAQEMRLYLDRWMRVGHPTAALRRAWLNEDKGFQSRIVEVAQAQLALLDASLQNVRGGLHAHGKRLFWILTERTYPRVRLTLLLAAMGGNHPLGAVEMQSPNPAPGATALRFVSLGDGSGVEYLGPVERISLDAVLGSPVTLLSEDGIELRHDVRPVIPLYQRDDARYYQECQRVQPLVTHVVICHEMWRDRVLEFLGRNALNGFSEVAGAVPQGWLLYRDVIIPPGAVDERYDLQCLLPPPLEDSISFLGGLRLSGSLWHAKAAPTVLVDPSIRYESISVVNRRGDVLLDQTRESFNPAALSTLTTDLAGLDLTLRIKGPKESQDRARAISFRSADTPQPRGPNDFEALVYDMGDPSRPHCGMSAGQAQTGKWVSGFVTEGIPVPAAGAGLRASGTPLDVGHLPTGEPDEPRSYDLRRLGGSPHICINTGLHHIEFEQTTGTCKHCNEFFWVAEWKERIRRQETARSRNRRGQTAAQRPVPDHIQRKFAAKALDNQARIDHDLVLDGLCFKTQGNWDSLRQWLSLLAVDPAEIPSLYRGLIDLGLLDIAMDEHGTRPSRWCVPPPVLVCTEGAEMFLAGFRCDSLLGQLEQALETHGIGHLVRRQDRAPTAHYWRLGSHSIETIRSLINGISDPFGRQIALVEDAASRIASAMPLVSQTLTGLDPVSVNPSAEVERFDLRTRRWEPARISSPGAYRADAYGLTYFFFDGTVARQGTYDLVKLLAARHASTYLYRYVSATRTFECAVGCEPPGLFRRALVAASGQLPVVSGGMVSYSHVPERTAALILERLYN